MIRISSEALIDRKPRWNRWIWLTCLLFVMSLVWVGGVAAQAPDGATLVGEVINGTPDGMLPVGAAVTLQFFSGDTWTSTYTTTLASDGTFRFEGLGGEVGNDYLARVIHEDVAYYSEAGTFDGASDASTIIHIYEPGGDASTIQVDQAHLFLVPQGDRVEVAEYYLIGNTGNRTYLGTPLGGTGVLTTVAFTAPAGAGSMSFNGPGLGARYVGDVNHFADTLPIPPGTATVEADFSYDLPYYDGLVLTRSLGVPIQSVVIIVSGSDVGVEGDGIVFNGLMDTQMGTAASYTAGPLAAGVPLTLRMVPQEATATQAVSDGSSATSTPRARNAGLEAGLGAAALVVGGIAAYRVWSVASPLPPLPESAEATVAEVVALEDRYHRGDLDAEAYQRERAVLIRRLSREVRKAAAQ